MVDQTATEQRRGKIQIVSIQGISSYAVWSFGRFPVKKKKGHEIDECIFVSGSQGLAVFYDNKVQSRDRYVQSDSKKNTMTH